MHHVNALQIVVICLLLYHLKYIWRSQATFAISTTKTLLKFGETAIVVEMYATDTFVESKMIGNYDKFFKIDRNFMANNEVISYYKIKVFTWKIVLIFFTCVVLKVIFFFKNAHKHLGHNFLGSIISIVVGISTIRWIVCLYVCGTYIDKLNEKILDLTSTKNKQFRRMEFVHKTINNLKYIESSYSQLYQLIKNIESSLCVSVAITVCYTYLKILWNFYFACIYFVEGKSDYFDGVSYNIIHIFPLFGIVLPCVVLQRKFERILGNFNVATSKLAFNNSICEEKLVGIQEYQ